MFQTLWFFVSNAHRRGDPCSLPESAAAACLLSPLTIQNGERLTDFPLVVQTVNYTASQ